MILLPKDYLEMLSTDIDNNGNESVGAGLKAIQGKLSMLEKETYLFFVSKQQVLLNLSTFTR